MVDLVSFDIYLLGLRDASSPGRTRFLNAMERISGRQARDFEGVFSDMSEPLFRSLSREKAAIVVKVLEEAGVRIEIRPSSAPPAADGDQMATTNKCPSCSFVQPVGSVECQKCGLVFAKWEREQVQHMQSERALEEALQRALQVRQEWMQRANQFLETHPIQPEATAPFEQTIVVDEIPFLPLTSDEGPVLLTSRRLVCSRDEGIISIPYELIRDVDVGGGLVPRKNRVRLQLTFHGPLLFAEGPSKTIVWHFDKDSGFYKDTVMDWAFARNFICGVCGSPNLDFRLEGTKPHTRCMHCATDHEVDGVEAVAIPIIHEA